MKSSKIKLICPLTHSVISDTNQIGAYVRHTSKRLGISTEELKYMIYVKTFGDIVTKNKFKHYYKNLSYTMPMFLKEFSLQYRMTEFLLKYHNIDKRTQKETNDIVVKKTKSTMIERYGVDHTFKVPEFDKKRRKTYVEKYGVDNPFKMKRFQDIMEKGFQKKYGISVREKRSVESKRVWGELSEEGKNIWLDKSIFSDKSKKAQRSSCGGFGGSNLEAMISTCLIDMGINFEHQLRIKRKFYDFLIKDLGIIIEVQGTYFHADPNIYKETDIIALKKKTAKEVWEYDEEKKKLANSKGYSIVYIWEEEMKYLNNEQLTQLIYEKLIKN